MSKENDAMHRGLEELKKADVGDVILIDEAHDFVTNLTKEQLIEKTQELSLLNENYRFKLKTSGKIINDLNLHIADLRKNSEDNEIARLRKEVAIRDKMIAQLKNPYRELDIFSSAGKNIVMIILSKLHDKGYMKHEQMYFIEKSLQTQKKLNDVSLAEDVEKQYLENKTEVDIKNSK